jgi:SsrA-binding protein
MHISKYEHSNIWTEFEELRKRKLLLNKKELNKLFKNVETEGYTIIPLKLYFNDKNKCKIEIGLCKGKKTFDKKQSLKEKDIKKYNDRINNEK